MSKEINLSLGGDYTNNRKDVKDAMRAIFQDKNIEEERLELLQNILDRSNVQFASISDKVSVNFDKFVRLVLTHDLEPLLEQLKKGSVGAESYVVVSSDLLTDISNCEKVDEDEVQDVNVLSGIFIYGTVSGLILSLLVAIVFRFINFSIQSRDLVFVLLGCLAFIIIPIVIIVFEPYLKGIQKKHNEFFQRVVGFFTGKM